jgi:hypothetical protein
MGLPVLVDGSKTPDQIPDTLAYQHFFTAAATHPVATAPEQGRQAAQLLLLQLAPTDQQTLISGLASFQTQLDQIASAALLATTPDQIAGLQTQRSALVTKTLANLQQVLTSDGASKLDQYVKTRVKVHIVIYGGPM